MTVRNVGSVWTPELQVRNAAGTLTAATVVLSVTSTAGVVTAPTVTSSATGVYTAAVPVTSAGRWLANWTVSGAITDAAEDSAYVRSPGSWVVTVKDIRPALNKTLTVDDLEIEGILNDALDTYEEFVGPLPGTH